MKTSIDKAGRVVIPASIRERAGLVAGSELDITSRIRESACSAWRPGPGW